ncbi:hypothetical protein FACS1894111_10050 [Clostridia bacterium]|nr:hypothetical protein FACS1894111_10050 [Clostridia bacterium]
MSKGIWDKSQLFGKYVTTQLGNCRNSGKEVIDNGKGREILLDGSFDDRH